MKILKLLDDGTVRWEESEPETTKLSFDVKAVFLGALVAVIAALTTAIILIILK